MLQRLVPGALVVLAVFQASLARADIKPNGIFTDNAVLQRDVKLPVWGTTDKPEKVTVSFAGQEVSGRAEGQPVASRAGSAAGQQPTSHAHDHPGGRRRA